MNRSAYQGTEARKRCWKAVASKPSSCVKVSSTMMLTYSDARVGRGSMDDRDDADDSGDGKANCWMSGAP
jgi:hypothetical protein